MDVYHYDRDTGVFVGLGEAAPNPLEPDSPIVPGWATPEANPATEAGRVAIFQRPDGAIPQNYGEGAWVVVPDYRGRDLYRTANGYPFQLGSEYQGIGDLPSFLTTEPRPSVAHEWVNDEWAINTELETQLLTAEATVKRAQLLAQADADMQPLFDNFFLGENTPEEDAKRVALSVYRKALRAVNVNDPRNIVWPVKP